MRAQIYFISLFLLTSVSKAVDWEKPGPDTLGFEASILVPQLNIQVLNQSTSDQKRLDFTPNSPGAFNLGISYRNVGASVSSYSAVDDKSQEEKGRTTTTDFQLRFYGPKLTHELFYQKYKGYYINNSSMVDSSYEGSTKRILRPNLQSSHYGYQLTYNFQSEHFSMPASFGHFMRTVTTCGSILGFLYADEQSLSDTENIIPQSLESTFKSAIGINQLKASSLGAGLAYGFHLNYKGSYLAGLLGLGFGSLNSKFSGTTTNFETTRGASKTLARFSAGYNGILNAFGLQVITDLSSYKIRSDADDNIVLSTTEMRLFYAYRFSGVKLPAIDKVSSLFD